MDTRHWRSTPASDNSWKKAAAVKPQPAKKRVPLSDITNRRTASSLSAKPLVPCAARSVKNEFLAATHDRGSSASSSANPDVLLTARESSTPGKVFPAPRVIDVDSHAPSSSYPVCEFMNATPGWSTGSISFCETMSTSDSLGSPEVEYLDDGDTTGLESNGMKTVDCSPGRIYKRDLLKGMELTHRDKLMDPQFCATIVCDIYENLRMSEVNKRPSTDFMERVQKDVNGSMRAVLIDWLVEVAEEYRFVPETLFLAVNFIDRYLSGNAMKRQRLQLLGVACMMIAAKYEEVCAPQVEEFCYITDGTYCKEEILHMEYAVLNYLKFEMTSPTANYFLRWFLWVAQGYNEDPSIQLEYLSSYLAELCLLEYSMLCYAPSLIAASAIFLAKYILFPAKKPWNSSLGYYTLYRPSDLCRCVKSLHHLCRNGSCSNVAAVRQKYSQHKYKFVAKKYCPPSIPLELFED